MCMEHVHMREWNEGSALLVRIKIPFQSRLLKPSELARPSQPLCQRYDVVSHDHLFLTKREVEMPSQASMASIIDYEKVSIFLFQRDTSPIPTYILHYCYD